MKRSRLIPTLLGAVLIVGMVGPNAWASYTIHNFIVATQTAGVNGDEFATCGDRITGQAGWATNPYDFENTYHGVPGTGAYGYEVFQFEAGENPALYTYDDVTGTMKLFGSGPAPDYTPYVVKEAPNVAPFTTSPLVPLAVPIPQGGNNIYSNVDFDVAIQPAAPIGSILGIKPTGGGSSLRQLHVVDCSPSPVDQTITFDSISDKTLLESGFSISPTASSGLPVSVSSTDTTVCDVSGGSVVLTAPGTCSLKAEQAGNGSFNAAPSVTKTFMVSKADQTITFDPLKNRWFFLRAVKVPSPTSSSGLPVTLTTTTPTVCNITRGLVVFRRPGICSLSANQAGNGTYNPAPTVTRSFRIL